LKILIDKKEGINNFFNKIMRYYGVRKGWNSGVYTSWKDFNRQICGFEGAEYFCSYDRDKVVAFMNYDKNKKIDTSVAEAFVDGSYDPKTKIVGSGFILLFPSGHEIRKSFHSANVYNSGNVFGELKATTAAVEECKKLGCKNIIIFHDYNGIRTIVDCSSKARSAIAKMYKKQMSQLSKGMHITFVKVKAHSGNQYNTVANHLSRKAIEDYIYGKQSVKEGCYEWKF